MRKIIASLLLLVAMSVTTVFAQTQNHNHRLYIQNRSGIAIYNVYISSASLSTWGMDMLGDDIIPNGNTQFATLRGHRWYDVKVIQSDDTTCVERIDLNANKTLVVGPYSCYVSTSTTNTQY